jgi:hypothetical protein
MCEVALADFLSLAVDFAVVDLFAEGAGGFTLGLAARTFGAF